MENRFSAHLEGNKLVAKIAREFMRPGSELTVVRSPLDGEIVQFGYRSIGLLESGTCICGSLEHLQ